ncbi:D-2-hydroxyacid dehydrogenase [Dactylosporangium sp. NPDC000555]|uniref:D-2-hydroxyacid dehydrogenase n=1 Tax=Dactylosporangium sp. NPDC000555 TaxID=3154260 RepID=UPI003320960E
MLGPLPGPHRDRIAAAWPEACIADSGSGDVVLSWTYDPQPVVDLLTSAAPPRWVQLRSVGVDERILALTAAAGTTLTTGRGAHGVAVAEHAVTLLLAVLRGLPGLVGQQRDRVWLVPPTLGELAGRTVGVIGAGDVGGHVAALIRAFGTRVRVLRYRAQGRLTAPPALPWADELYGPDEREAFLAGLQVLVVAAPLTPATRGMLGEREFALVAPGCVVINVARGPIIDHAALVSALRRGHLGGAALDVTDPEPLPPHSALWSEPGVLLTPHCADHTRATDTRFVDLYLDRVRRFRSGQPLDAVDPAVGY